VLVKTKEKTIQLAEMGLQRLGLDSNTITSNSVNILEILY
jgi:hypothetical protein